jgi:hypothetical protein
MLAGIKVRVAEHSNVGCEDVLFGEVANLINVSNRRRILLSRHCSGTQENHREHRLYNDRRRSKTRSHGAQK